MKQYCVTANVRYKRRSTRATHFKIKESSKFVIQLDESTDITKMAYLLAYYVKDLLFCQPLHGRTAEMDIFRIIVADFFKEVGLFWMDCVGVCTNKAAAMTGLRAGFHAIVRSPSDTPTTFTHCMIHGEDLVAKKISPDLNAVVQEAKSSHIHHIKCV